MAAAKLQPDNAFLYLVLANIHSQLENGPALLEDLNNYLRLAPTGPIADKARAQQKQLQDELAKLKQMAPEQTPTAPEPVQTTKIETLDRSVADASVSDSPEINSPAKVLKPVLWPPTNVDAAVPPVSPDVTCPLPQVLKGARLRVQELLDNLDRFTATEVIDSSEIGIDEARGPGPCNIPTIIWPRFPCPATVI